MGFGTRNYDGSPVVIATFDGKDMSTSELQTTSSTSLRAFTEYMNESRIDHFFAIDPRSVTVQVDKDGRATSTGTLVSFDRHVVVSGCTTGASVGASDLEHVQTGKARANKKHCGQCRHVRSRRRQC